MVCSMECALKFSKIVVKIIVGNIGNNIANDDFDACREVCWNHLDIRDLPNEVEKYLPADDYLVVISIFSCFSGVSVPPF